MTNVLSKKPGLILLSVSVFSGAYFLSHSLSWSSNKENHGLYGKKVWIPEDPRTAKANGHYPTEG